ncbi:translocation/assembly module TamB domain-containing protein [Candidatus Margulisiibacteriota bacterium]
MKKLFVLFSIISLFLICGWSPPKVSVYKNLKKDVKSQLQELFNREVEIEEVSGILVNQIELRNIRIAKGKTLKSGNILTAKKIYLNYNPFKLAAHKGDMIPALSKIVIIEPEFTIERYKDDTWNMLKLLPAPAEGDDTEAPTFNGTIVIKNGHGWYKDHLGFGEALAGRVFTSKFKDMNGEVKIEKNKITLSVATTSIIDKSYASAKIDGDMNTVSGKYNFIANIQNLDLSKWGYYVLNVPNVKPISGRSDMKLTMTNPPKREKGLPILFTGDFNVRNGKVIIAGKEMKDIYGFIYMHDEEVKFKNLHGKIYDTAAVLNGKIHDFTLTKFKLAIQAKKFDLKKLDRIFGIKPWKIDFSGIGNAKLFITGDHLNPKYNGEFNITKGTFLSRNISGPGLFRLEGPILSVKLNGIRSLRGKVFAEGIFDISPAVPSFAFTATTEALSLKELTGLKEGISGTANISTKITGNINSARLEGEAALQNCEITGQKFERSAFDIGFSEKGAAIQKFTLRFKNTSFAAAGTIRNYSYLNLDVRSNNINLAGKGDLGPLKATMGKFDGKLYGKMALAEPAGFLKNINLEGDVSFFDIEIGEQFFYQANGAVKFRDNTLMLDNFLFQVQRSFLNVDGSIGLGGPTNLKISGKDIELTEISPLKYLVPKELQPFDGKADADIIVTGNISQETPLQNIFSGSNINLSGNILLKGCKFASETVEEGDIRFSWNDNKLVLEDSKIRTSKSNVNFYGVIDADKLIDLRVKGTLNLSNIRPFMHKYGQIFGELGMDLGLSGTLNAPNISAIFTGTNIKYNKLDIDKISGNIFYNGELLNFIDPLKINQKDDEYRLSGKILLKEFKKENLSYIKPHLAINCEVVKGTLGTLLTFLDTINNELISKNVQVPETTETPSSAIQQFDILNLGGFLENQRIVLYSIDRKEQKRQSVLHSIDSVKKELESYKETVAGARKINAGGNIQGYIKFSGDIDNLNGVLSMKVDSGNFESYYFDEVELKARLIGGTFEVETANIKQEDGIVKLSGSFNPNSNIDLKIDAIKMPIDFLSLFTIGEGRSFKGSFSMHAEARGKFNNPDISVSLKSYDPEIANIKFNDISAKLSYTDSLLSIERVKLTSKNNKEVEIRGSLPFIDGKPIEIQISMEGESVGLLSLASPGTRWIGGSGKGEVLVSGTISRPKFDGYLDLVNASVFLKPLSSYFRSTNARVDIENNKILISNFSSQWVGNKTGAKINTVALQGTVDINDLFTKDKKIIFNLRFDDGSFAVNDPNLYSGDLRFKNLSITGPYYIEQDKPGPTLSADLKIENGEIRLLQADQESVLPPFNLNINMAIEKNSYATAGEVEDIMSTNFSNIFLHLEVESKDLTITGTLREPNIKGNVKFNRGVVNILNREFTLISEERQKTLFAADLDKVKENQATFYGRGGNEGILPFLDLTSEIKIRAVEEEDSALPSEESPEEKKDTEKKYKTQDVVVVSRISGIPFVKEKERGVTLTFMSFTEDLTKHETVPGKYSDQEIKVLLLPEFIKRPLGIKEGGSVDTNEVIVDYLNSRLNAFLLRGIEREVAKSLDLERLTLEYNFGKDLRTLFPAQTQRDVEYSLEREEMVYGVGFAKGFFDRFYIDVKYSQAAEEAAGTNRSLFNYQLTYKLNPTLSVLYFKEPLSFIEEEKIILRLAQVKEH